MYSQRTVSILKHELDILNIKYKSIGLGEIDFYDDIKMREIYNLDRSLYLYRLSLILINSKLVTDIRETILEIVRQNIRPEPNFSDHLTRKLGYNFAYLNMYFTLETGLSIEKYYNLKTTETMSYGDLHYKN
jgi:hypothetical protein